MEILIVERIGGLAGFGGRASPVRSRGRLDMATLEASERRAIEALFASRGDAGPGQLRDGFRYRISRTTPAGIETIEAWEGVVPAVLSRCVKDEFIERP